MTQDDFDQVWDENQWEKHLLSFESESDRLRKFINATWGETTPAWERLMQEYATKTDVVDAYVEEELMFEESAFPDDDDDFGDDDDDDFDDEFFLYDDEDDLDDEEDDEDEEGFLRAISEAQQEQDEENPSAFQLIGHEAGDDPDLLLYDRSRALGAAILSWREQFGEVRPPSEVDAFITGVLQMSAKLAAAYWFGFEMAFLGANIAYTKKALQLTNQSLERLKNLHTNGIISRTTYMDFSEKLHDLRNDMGVSIQEMRDEFKAL